MATGRWLRACGLSAAVGVGLAGVASLADPPTTQPAASGGPRPFRPIQTVERMMEGQKKLFDEIKDGIIDKAWPEAETSAWLLAELANVNHYQTDKDGYRDLADRMADQCVELAKIIAKRDVTGAKTAVQRLGETCTACHDEYRK